MEKRKICTLLEKISLRRSVIQLNRRKIRKETHEVKRQGK